MLKIRLRRMGAIRQPHYRIVVADARAPRDGHFIEILGHYNPRTEPATIQVDVAKYEEWKRKGAQPTDAVDRLVRQFNRAARKAEALAGASVEAAAPTADRRTRTASGKRMTQTAAAPANEAAPEAAPDVVEEPEIGAVAVPSAAPVEAEEVAGEEATDEPVLEAATATPEGAAEGTTDTDTAS
jgi:small subunit ribosomal protein S16